MVAVLDSEKKGYVRFKDLATYLCLLELPVLSQAQIEAYQQLLLSSAEKVPREGEEQLQASFEPLSETAFLGVDCWIDHAIVPTTHSSILSSCPLLF